jgi:hypothetical protein
MQKRSFTANIPGSWSCAQVRIRALQKPKGYIEGSVMAAQQIDIGSYSKRNEETYVANFDMEEEVDLLAQEEAEVVSKDKSSDEDTYQKNLDATQLYLNEIGFSPLLSAEEEVFFCPQSTTW